MTTPTDWRHAGPPGGTPAGLDQVLGGLPPKERRQLGGVRERMALHHVAGVAGPESIWGVVSCRTQAGAGVIALTDGRVLISILNSQHQMWHVAVPLNDVGAVEYSPGGLGQSGCAASLAYGDSTVLGFFVGRDTDYALAFLRMIDEQVEAADGSAVIGQGGPAPQRPAADDAMLASFVRDAMQRGYPGQWVDWLPGVECSVVVGGAGLLVRHDDGRIRFAVHVLSDLPFSPDLVAEVAEVNSQIPIGAFHLRRAPTGEHWHLMYGYAVLAGWIDPESWMSGRLMHDVLHSVPRIVGSVAGRITIRHGGVRVLAQPDAAWQATTAALR